MDRWESMENAPQRGSHNLQRHSMEAILNRGTKSQPAPPPNRNVTEENRAREDSETNSPTEAEERDNCSGYKHKKFRSREEREPVITPHDAPAVSRGKGKRGRPRGRPRVHGSGGRSAAGQTHKKGDPMEDRLFMDLKSFNWLENKIRNDKSDK